MHSHFESEIIHFLAAIHHITKRDIEIKTLDEGSEYASGLKKTNWFHVCHCRPPESTERCHVHYYSLSHFLVKNGSKNTIFT